MSDIDFMEDSLPDTSEIEKLIATLEALSDRANDLDSEAERLEEEAKELKKKSARIREEDMPNLMDKLNAEEHKSKDGKVLTLKDIVKASIADSNRSEVFKWLRSNGHGSLIKNEVAVRLGKGEDQKAAEIKKFFHELSIPFEMKETVHHSTLNAFVKEMRSKGVALPDSISVFNKREVKITKAK